MKEVKFAGANFFCWQTLDVFVCSSTTIDCMDKWKLQLNSACLKGTEIPFQGILTVDGDGL